MGIRECNKNDLNDIYSLICELENKKMNISKFELAFKKKMDESNCYCVVGTISNKIISYLSLNITYQLHHSEKVATIEELIVNSEYKNNGYGKLLIEKAIEYS